MNPSENPQPPTGTPPDNGETSQDPLQPEQSEQTTTPQPTLQAVVSGTAGGDSSSSGKLKKILLTLLVLIILGGLGYALYAFLNKEEAAPTQQRTSQVTKQDIALIKVGVISGNVQLYPPVNNDAYSQAVYSQIFEGLVQYEDESKLVPNLATGWTNPDNSTWDFSLKKNVKFHNGHTMTAEDVAYSLNFAKDNETLADVYANTIKEVSVVDGKVRVVTTQPDPFFLNKLSFLMIMDSQAKDVTDGSNGTGPYVIKEGAKPSETQIDLVAFDDYHGGHVYTRALTYIVEPDDETAAKDLKDGKINIAGDFTSAEPNGLSGFSFHKSLVNDTAVTFIMLNSLSNGPFKDKEVREALRLSIDIDKLVKDTDTEANPTSQLITKAIPGYDPDLKVPAQNVAKAKELLAKAGHPNGVSFTLNVAPQSKAIGDAVAVQAKEAGFTINVVAADSFGVLLENMAEGKNDATMISYSSDVLDGSDVFKQVIQGTKNYQSDDLDKLLEDAAGTLNQAERLAILQKASKHLYDNAAVVSLFNRNRLWASDKPYAINFDNLAQAPGISFWKVYLPQ